MDYSKKIFEILGIEPNEVFKIKGKEGKWQITNDLRIYQGLCLEDSYRIVAILAGEYEIIKIPQWTEDEKIIAKFAKLNGTEFFAKDDDGYITIYQSKPNKSVSFWESYNNYITIDANMPHITTDRVYTANEILEEE